MAAGFSVPRFGRNHFMGSKPNSFINPSSFLSPSILRPPNKFFTAKKKGTFTIYFVLEEQKQGIRRFIEEDKADISSSSEELINRVSVRVAEKLARAKSERYTFLVAIGIISVTVAAVYYRFSWQMEGGEIPVSEMFGTFALAVGAAVGMEFWSRWAHKALWHASLWHMHESHHQPREGPFELNDVFAIINAVPAIALLNYGFFHRGLFPALCFGAGIGFTVLGMAYIFVHNGIVHRRFPVGPIANFPYFRKVAAAHKIHHMDKFEGVPYGLFLGPMELEEVGGSEELEKEINRRIKLSNDSR